MADRADPRLGGCLCSGLEIARRKVAQIGTLVHQRGTIRRMPKGGSCAHAYPQDPPPNIFT